MSDGNTVAYSLAVDMWSIGVILFILLSGYSPFWCACYGGLAAESLRRWQDPLTRAAVRTMRCFAHGPPWCLPADDDVDAVLFEKIRSGEYDADDPIWDSISEQVEDLLGSAGAFLQSPLLASWPPSPTVKRWLPQAKDLVAQLLVVDPSQRLSAKEALAHPWIQARPLRTIGLLHEPVLGVVHSATQFQSALPALPIEDFIHCIAGVRACCWVQSIRDWPPASTNSACTLGAAAAA